MQVEKTMGKAVQYAVRGSKVRLVPAESYMIGPFFILSKHHESVTIQGGDYSMGKEKERGEVYSGRPGCEFSIMVTATDAPTDVAVETQVPVRQGWRPSKQ